VVEINFTIIQLQVQKRRC